MQSDWLGLRKELPERRRLALTFLSFALPVLLWCAVSYVPWIWHPMVKVRDPGDVPYFKPGMLITRPVFTEENRGMREQGKREAGGSPANPIYLPAPHEVAAALVKAFQAPPRLPTEPWLHQSLWHSIRIIFWGFAFSSLLGLPLGILCGSFRAAAKLTEPFIEFFRYLPAPAFGALCVAVMGIHDAPKIAIIFIGTFFQQVLVIANTTRQIDPVLLESALTLGASKFQLVWKVIIPGTITGIYNDMRILLGWAWTYLIVAELIGTTSGITYFINQQGRYRNYENVYAAIMMIGIIGLGTDIFLAWLGKYLFPWKRGHLRMPWDVFMDFLRPNLGKTASRPKP
jgi:NitT/TauT family transport system permease protein